MVTVELFTRAGARIHEAAIPAPPSGDAPDVIVWDRRLFVVPEIDHRHIRTLEDDDCVAYVEALVYELPRTGKSEGC